MPSLRTVLVIVGLTIAFGGVAIMAANELTATAGRMNRRIGGFIRPESVRTSRSGVNTSPRLDFGSHRTRHRGLSYRLGMVWPAGPGPDRFSCRVPPDRDGA